MSNHQWCRDVRRDEAVRAAEDAAAVPEIQHRDLPEAVADLRERVARLEAAQATLGSGDEIARLTAERDAAIRERDAARACVAELEAAPPPRGWLTAEDCEALYLANAALHGVFVGSWQEKHDAAKKLEAIRWRALGAAGGEVEG